MHAPNSRRRPLRRAVVAALTVCAPAVLATVVTATPAEARCQGNGTPVTMILRNGNGTEIAKERANAGTCNGNLAYGGAVQDSFADGSCANLRIWDNTAGGYIDDVTECTTGAWQSFSRGEADGYLYFELSADGFFVTRANYGF